MILYNQQERKVSTKMRRKYKFEWNDLRALTTVINVILIMIYGLSISWFGLALAILGIIKDVTDKDFRWNGFIMHLSNAVLNVFFLVYRSMGIRGYLLAYILSEIVIDICLIITADIIKDLKKAHFDRDLFKRMVLFSSPLILTTKALRRKTDSIPLTQSFFPPLQFSTTDKRHFCRILSGTTWSLTVLPWLFPLTISRAFCDFNPALPGLLFCPKYRPSSSLTKWLKVVFFAPSSYF